MSFKSFSLRGFRAGALVLVVCALGRGLGFGLHGLRAVWSSGCLGFVLPGLHAAWASGENIPLSTSEFIVENV